MTYIGKLALTISGFYINPTIERQQSLTSFCSPGIVALSDIQQRELNVSSSLDGLHFPALIVAETHIVVEDVAVSCIQFPQERTPRAFACAEYRVWPHVVGKDSQEHLFLAVAVEHTIELHQVLTQQPVTLCLCHRPCTVAFPRLQLVTPSDVWIVAHGVPALEVLDNLHRQIETLHFRHGWWMVLCFCHYWAEYQQDGDRQPCQCLMIAIA